MFSFLRQPPKPPSSVAIDVDGHPVDVVVRISARARAFRLSLTASGPVLTLPRAARWSDAEAFLHHQRHWLAARLPRTAAARLLQADALLPLRGTEHRIVASGSVRGRVELRETGEGPILLVPGAPEHQPRRLYDWLRGEAMVDLERQSHFHAERLGVTVSQIRLKSQASRWGSCSSTGAINYNWRLILAPPFVLDYVAAHEVAHLVEMNHSPAFWATVERALPDMARGRAWLKAHGRELMAWQKPGSGA